MKASRTGKSSPGEAGTLKIRTGFFQEGKALSRENEQNLRRGSGASSFPGTQTREMCPRGECHRLWAELGKGLERAPSGASGEAQAAAPGGGGYALLPSGATARSAIPAAQAPDPRALRGHSPGSCAPPRTGGGGEGTGRQGLSCCWAPPSCADQHHPPPPQEHPGQCGLETVVVNCGS